MRRTVAICACLLGLASGFAAARQPGPEARRDDLAKVQEALADPDPMQRLANMEAIVAAGDPIKTEVAVRTAFASDDADLRGLAMRAYLAARHEMTFDVLLPAAVQKQYDSTQDGDPAQRREFLAANRYVSALSRMGFKLRLELAGYEFPQDTGSVKSVNRTVSAFTIKGDRFSTFTTVPGAGNCYLDFAPTPALKLDGTMVCQGGWPKLAITSELF